MSTLKQEALKIIENMPDDIIIQAITYLKTLSSKENSYERKKRAFDDLQSFAGTLPEDFDYKRELEEARMEKYDRSI